MTFFPPDLVPKAAKRQKRVRSVAFQSILRKRIRKLPKILKILKIIQFYSVLFNRVLNERARLIRRRLPQCRHEVLRERLLPELVRAERHLTFQSVHELED